MTKSPTKYKTLFGTEFTCFVIKHLKINKPLHDFLFS